jgi:hypothetical protein
MKKQDELVHAPNLRDPLLAFKRHFSQRIPSCLRRGIEAGSLPSDTRPLHSKHATLLDAAGSTRPPSNHALGGHAYLWAIALNSFGTLFLVGGSLLSIVRRQRVRVNVWIGLGALVVALSTGLSRAGTYSLVYAGELVGIALMFAGFTFSFAGRPAPSRPKVSDTLKVSDTVPALVRQAPL